MAISFKAMWNYKCPRCRKGDLFKKPFNISKPLDMNYSCSNCGKLFEPEPGYYFGAMFISYIFTAFFCISFTLFLHWGLGWSTAASFGLLLFVLAVLFVFIFRLSRTVYINLNVSYDPEAVKRGGSKGQKGTASLYGKTGAPNTEDKTSQ